jgi:hypothetical protein
VLQASVAVAEPSAAFISLAVVLQPSVNVVPVAVITGGVRSPVHVTVLAVVAIFPQSSIAVNVRVCDTVQPSVEVVVGASSELMDTVPQPSLPDAVPRAALISVADGLQPRVVVVPLATIVGGVRSIIQLIVLDAVAVLPQASIAVNVLVCEAEQLPADVITAPSEKVMVTALHASDAVAVPKAASISDAVGLHPSAGDPAAVIVGGVRSTILIVAGDWSHPAIVLAVPAGIEPHASAVTYLTLIL